MEKQGVTQKLATDKPVEEKRNFMDSLVKKASRKNVKKVQRKGVN